MFLVIDSQSWDFESVSNMIKSGWPTLEVWWYLSSIPCSSRRQDITTYGMNSEE